MKMYYNYKHLTNTLSPKAIKKLQKIEKGEYPLDLNENIIFTFDLTKVKEDLKTFRENNPEYYCDLGTFSFWTNEKEGKTIVYFKEISIKKMWRILHIFGDALIYIRRVKTHYVACDHFGKIYRKEFFRIWGTCPKYKDTGNYRISR